MKGVPQSQNSNLGDIERKLDFFCVPDSSFATIIRAKIKRRFSCFHVVIRLKNQHFYTKKDEEKNRKRQKGEGKKEKDVTGVEDPLPPPPTPNPEHPRHHSDARRTTHDA